jgi:lipoate-protein ligase A
VKLLDVTLPTPAENVALDEALLEVAETSSTPCELLRLWEPIDPMVVVGRSSRIAGEVNETACQELGVSIVRRTSGGAAIVAARGCLMYAVVLDLERRPELRAIDRAHTFVLESLTNALRKLVPQVAPCGTSDLAIGDRKFSGNSLRVKRRALLYHGTLLYAMPLDLVARCLTMPPRLPDYRQGRAHTDFVTNLPIERTELVAAMGAAWSVTDSTQCWPRELTQKLVAEKYSRHEWNYQR